MSVPELVNGIGPPTTSVAFQPYRDRQPRPTLATEHMLADYSDWKSGRNYDTIATGLEVCMMALCHAQVTLMLSTDINITETTYSCQFQYVFGNQ